MKNILVPISFTQTSRSALHQAVLIGKQFNAKLSLLHCYAAEEYNRKYDFGKLDYEKGIEQMLLDFYHENNEHQDDENLNLLTYTGSVSNVISQISPKFNLLVLGRKISNIPKSSNSLSDKLLYLSSKSLCPVLLTPTNRSTFSFSDIKKVWHIKRKENEITLINRQLLNLKINQELVTSKSLQQESFTSNFWKNIVRYTKDHDSTQLKKIAQSFSETEIDLLILVNHKKNMFEQFLKDDAFRIISQFDIPILILKSN